MGRRRRRGLIFGSGPDLNPELEKKKFWMTLNGRALIGGADYVRRELGGASEDYPCE